MLNTETKQLAGNILAQMVGGLASTRPLPTVRDPMIASHVELAITYAKALEEAAKKA